MSKQEGKLICFPTHRPVGCIDAKTLRTKCITLPGSPAPPKSSPELAPCWRSSGSQRRPAAFPKRHNLPPAFGPRPLLGWMRSWKGCWPKVAFCQIKSDRLSEPTFKNMLPLTVEFYCANFRGLRAAAFTVGFN